MTGANQLLDNTTHRRVLLTVWNCKIYA